MPQRTYYQILQVDPEASIEVIEAAYRRLARIYHPDVNKSPDAGLKMRELNEAYETLRDFDRRRAYDASLQASHRSETTGAGHYADQDNSDRSQTSTHSDTFASQRFPFHCQRCGQSNATLRIAVFPYVISILIVTFRRAWSGVYCTECCKRKMLSAKILTFFLGWWGIPFGILYTLGVLFKPSQGMIIGEANGPFLGALGAHFLQRGQLAEAARAWEASLQYQPDQQLLHFYQQIYGSKPTLDKKPSHGQGAGILFGFVAVGLVAWILFGGQLFGAGSPSSYTEAKQAQPTVTATLETARVVRTLTVWPTSVPPTPTNVSPSLAGITPYYNRQANFRATIPGGYLVKEEVLDGDDPVYEVIFQPTDQIEGSDFSSILVYAFPLHVSEGRSSVATESQVESLALEWDDKREGWSRVSAPTTWTSSGRVMAEWISQSTIEGTRFEVVSYSMLVSSPGWLHYVEVVGLEIYADVVKEYYDAFKASFQPGS